MYQNFKLYMIFRCWYCLKGQNQKKHPAHHKSCIKRKIIFFFKDIEQNKVLEEHFSLERKNFLSFFLKKIISFFSILKKNIKMISQLKTNSFFNKIKMTILIFSNKKNFGIWHAWLNVCWYSFFFPRSKTTGACIK